MDAIDQGSLGALPLFPLPDAVLFPGSLLPLHVFEPRYRELAADVIAGPKLVGIVRLRPGFEDEYAGRPPIFDTAGVGYVIGHERFTDGRYHLLLRGVARVAIAEELAPERAYRRARTRLLVDTHTTRPGPLAHGHDQLVAMCDRLAANLREGGESLRELARAIGSPAGCSDVLAAALVSDADDRQKLLETLDPADRIDFLVGHVATLVARFAPKPSDLN